MSLIVCPDCAGLGAKVTRMNRNKAGRLKSVNFSLKDPCETCAGTGQALVKRNVLYVGRPDIAKATNTTSQPTESQFQQGDGE